MTTSAGVLRAVLVSLVTCVSTAIAPAADLPANLVNNPSLEEKVSADGLPQGWGAFYSEPAGAYRASIADGGRTGKKQMRLECIDEKKEASFSVLPAGRVPLDNANRYVARGWVKITGGKRATADVKLHYYDANGAYVGQTRIGFASPGYDDWQLVTVTDRAGQFPQAKQIGLAISCTGDAKAQYDDLELLAFNKDKLPSDFDGTYGVTVSPQLAILSRRVGTWETKTTIKPCLWVPQGTESTAVETIHWSLGGQLLEGHQKNPVSGVEQLSLMTYDARDQVYRGWFFGSDGNLPRSQSVGQWDKTTETLTFRNEVKDEFVSVVLLKLTGNDAVSWQGTWKDKDGRILLDIQATSKRRLLETTPATSPSATTALDGTWLAESLTMNGEVAPAAAVKQTWFKFNGENLSFKMDGPDMKGRCVLDNAKSPKHLDITLEKGPGVEGGYTVLGIYQLNGGRLEICLRGKSPDVRPTDFTSKTDSGRIWAVLKKQIP